MKTLVLGSTTEPNQVKPSSPGDPCARRQLPALQVLRILDFGELEEGNYVYRFTFYGLGFRVQFRVLSLGLSFMV